MRKKLLALTSLSVLTLSACGSPSEEDVLTDAKIQASQSAPQLPDVQLSENPEPPPAPPPPVVERPDLNQLDNMIDGEVAETGVPGTIPPAFQGRWGMAPEDCGPGDNLGTGMLVTADSIGLGDSVGYLQSVLADYPGRFVGQFEYGDGGQRREQLTFPGNRNVLVRVTGGERIVYRRCGAARPTG